MKKSTTLAVLWIITGSTWGLSADPKEQSQSRSTSINRPDHLQLPRQYRLPHNTKNANNTKNKRTSESESIDPAFELLNSEGNITIASHQQTSSQPIPASVQSVMEPTMQITSESRSGSTSLTTSTPKPRKVKATTASHMHPGTTGSPLQTIEHFSQSPIRMSTSMHGSTQSHPSGAGSFLGGGQYDFSYYFRPYQHTDIAKQQNAPFVSTRSNPYDNRWFETLYTE
jgi:hypothetical protein